MSFFNEKFLPIVQKAIKKMQAEGEVTFSTVKFIRKQWGSYCCNKSGTLHKSINVNIGLFLDENKELLKIKKIKSRQPAKDDNKKKTSCVIWKIEEV
jgi:hypothetical protein